MTSYYRVILGLQNANASTAFEGGFIGIDFLPDQDYSAFIGTNWNELSAAVKPAYMAVHPGKSNIGFGLDLGLLWKLMNMIKKGDIILSPEGNGAYRVGEVAPGDYYHAAGQPLSHRRRVNWRETRIAKSDLSATLKKCLGPGLLIIGPDAVTSHSDEIERLIGGMGPSVRITTSDPDIEDPIAFAMEKHLEEFLVANWEQTELNREFSILEEEGEQVGQQYETDAGPIDILAISKDRKRLLVIELKRGRASDVVLGQILRYMGYVKSQIAEPNQSVSGVIIALDDDQKLRWALTAAPSVDFYRYQVSFKLTKV
jgi:restriction system protein